MTECARNAGASTVTEDALSRPTDLHLAAEYLREHAARASENAKNPPDPLNSSKWKYAAMYKDFRKEYWELMAEGYESAAMILEEREWEV